MLWALLQGLISQRINMPHHNWSPRLAECAFDTLLSGMLLPQAGGLSR